MKDNEAQEQAEITELRKDLTAAEAKLEALISMKYPFAALVLKARDVVKAELQKADEFA